MIKKHVNAILFLTFLLWLISGCAGSGSPVSTSPNGLQNSQTTARTVSQTHLWGYWTVAVDPATGEVAVVPDRNVMFTVNVVNIINGKMGSISVKLNKIVNGSNYTDLDTDVSITHPFAGMPQYDGYDVRGIFMGDGLASMLYNSKLKYAVNAVDQSMLPSPDDGFGAPDGYTRWFNYSEFTGTGLPLFLYTQGKLASKNFAGTATLNPYKYYADGLKTEDDLWTLDGRKFRGARSVFLGKLQIHVTTI